MNKIELIGNVVRDPESSATQSGVKFTRFNLAVNRPYTNAEGNRDTDYFDIVCWRQLAERCAKYVFKGNKVAVIGQMQMRKYETRDGQKRTVYEVLAEEVEFLSNNGGNAKAQTEPKEKSEPKQQSMFDDLQPVDPEGLPF